MKVVSEQNLIICRGLTVFHNKNGLNIGNLLMKVNPDYSLEGLMLNLKLQYFGHLIRKHPDAGKYWRQEEKGKTEDEMVGWHHWLHGHEFEQTLGDSEGQGSLMCCSPINSNLLSIVQTWLAFLITVYMHNESSFKKFQIGCCRWWQVSWHSSYIHSIQPPLNQAFPCPAKNHMPGETV